MLKVSNVLGEEREVIRLWPDGSYTCPFCGAAVFPDDGREKPCPNPCCEANPRADRQEVLDKRAERERRQREREEARLRSEHIAQMQAESRRAREERIREAREAGYCVLCFVRSGERKRVRHRRPDFHG